MNAVRFDGITSSQQNQLFTSTWHTTMTVSSWAMPTEDCLSYDYDTVQHSFS